MPKITLAPRRGALKWLLFTASLSVPKTYSGSGGDESKARYSIPVFAAVSHYYDPGRGRAAGGAFYLVLLAGRAFCYLRRHVWFWLTVAVLITLHEILVVAIPRTNRSFSGRELWPFCFVDFLAIWGIIKLVEKVMTRSGEVRLTD